MPTLDERIEALSRAQFGSVSKAALTEMFFDLAAERERLRADIDQCTKAYFDLMTQREQLLAICRDVPGALNSAFAAGTEECEGGSARRQEKALAPVDDMRRRIRAALAQTDTAP